MRGVNRGLLAGSSLLRIVCCINICLVVVMNPNGRYIYRHIDPQSKKIPSRGDTVVIQRNVEASPALHD